MSTERLIVDESIADEFVQKVTAKAASLPFGDGKSGDVVLGSVADEDILDRVRSLVDDAKSKGAVIACGEVPTSGTFMGATVIDHVTDKMDIYGQESFGPVVSVIRARNADHAIELANDCDFGLAASVFGTDINEAIRVANSIESGICHINGPTVFDEAQMPFGGVKDSGLGHFGGQQGVEQFTQLRWLTIEDPHQHYPF